MKRTKYTIDIKNVKSVIWEEPGTDYRITNIEKTYIHNGSCYSVCLFVYNARDKSTVDLVSGIVKKQAIEILYKKNKKNHREDGPASLKYYDGKLKSYNWWLNGALVTREKVFEYAAENNNGDAVSSILFEKYVRFTF